LQKFIRFMATPLEHPLTPAQLEILKVLARPMSEDDLLALKRHIVRFFAERLTKHAGEVWDKRGWTLEDTEVLRQRHFRTPYRDTGRP
jgi:hypothetical protein